MDTQQDPVDMHLLDKFKMIAELWRRNEAKLDKTKNDQKLQN